MADHEDLGATAKSYRQVNSYHCARHSSHLEVNLLLRALVALLKVTAPVKLPSLRFQLKEPTPGKNKRVVFHLLYFKLLAQLFKYFHLAYTINLQMLRRAYSKGAEGLSV